MSSRSLAKTSCPGQVGRGGKARDFDGDGHADFIEPPALVYWAQELLPALLLLVLLQIASAGIFAHLLPQVSFATALYHCFVTATTVGYGDVPITTRVAQWHKWSHTVTLPTLPIAQAIVSHGSSPTAVATACGAPRRPTKRTSAHTHRYPDTPAPHTARTSAPLHLCTSTLCRQEAKLFACVHIVVSIAARHGTLVPALTNPTLNLTPAPTLTSAPTLPPTA